MKVFKLLVFFFRHYIVVVLLVGIPLPFCFVGTVLWHFGGTPIGV